MWSNRIPLTGIFTVTLTCLPSDGEEHVARVSPGSAVTQDQTAQERDLEFIEARSRTDSELRLEIIKIVTSSPDLDDVEIADQLGEDPFEISETLRSLAADGLIEAVS